MYVDSKIISSSFFIITMYDDRTSYGHKDLV